MRTPSDAVAAEDEGLFVDEITDRLKWQMLDPPDTAEILDLDGNGGPQWRPLLATPNHPFARKSVTEPPRSRILLALEIVHYWEYWHDALAEEDRPAPLLIENADGRPVSVGRLITKLHDYVKELRDLIYEIEDRDVSEDAILYLFSISGPTRKDANNPDALFTVLINSDVTTNVGFEEEWARKAQLFVRQHHPNPSGEVK